MVVASFRGISLFQEGTPPPASSTAYRALSTSPIQLIASDPSLRTSGIREMAAALGLLGLGDADATWCVGQSGLADPKAGALRVTTGVGDARVFFVANEGAGGRLEINSLDLPGDVDAIVIHSTSPVAKMPRSPTSAPGRT